MNNHEEAKDGAMDDVVCALPTRESLEAAPVLPPRVTAAILALHEAYEREKVMEGEYDAAVRRAAEGGTEVEVWEQGRIMDKLAKRIADMETELNTIIYVWR